MPSVLMGWLCASTRHKGKLLWMTNRLDGQIYVQLRPVKMIWRGPLNVRDGTNGGVPEPGKKRERDEQLLVSKQQPKAMHRYVGDLSRGIALTMRHGCHAHVPLGGSAQLEAHGP